MPARELPDRIDAVIFDFDETIIDLEPQHTAAHAALCAEHGADYGAMPESFRHGSGRRIVDDIREMRAFFGWREEEAALFARRQQLFDTICATSSLELMPGVREVVETLASRGFTLAITSSAVASSIELLLRRLALREPFARIVDGSRVVHGKPDPEAYLLTARELGAVTSHCVVFEDSEPGVTAAKRAGMYCIAVRNPRALIRQDLSSADAIVDSMREVDLTLFRRPA